MGTASPLQRTEDSTIPASAATADYDQAVATAPFAGTVSAVTYTPEEGITGADTNTRTLALVNKGADGNGTTVVASLALAAGVSAADFDAKAITLSAVAHATEVAAGDVLAWTSTHAGASGLADPGGLVSVTFTRVAGS